MLFSYMIRSLRDTFPTRNSEWGLATMLLLWGVILDFDPTLFARSPSFDGMARLFDQSTWAVLCFLTGVGRLAMLTVNGFWRRSPHLRAMGAFLGSGFWFQITLSFLQSETTSTGLAIYPVLFLLDAYNVLRALGDAGHTDKYYRAMDVRSFDK